MQRVKDADEDQSGRTTRGNRAPDRPVRETYSDPSPRADRARASRGPDRTPRGCPARSGMYCAACGRIRRAASRTIARRCARRPDNPAPATQHPQEVGAPLLADLRRGRITLPGTWTWGGRVRRAASRTSGHGDTVLGRALRRPPAASLEPPRNWSGPSRYMSAARNSPRRECRADQEPPDATTPNRTRRPGCRSPCATAPRRRRSAFPGGGAPRRNADTRRQRLPSGTTRQRCARLAHLPASCRRLAVEDRNRHAPEPLAGNARIRAFGEHGTHALLAPPGRPVHTEDFANGTLPERRRGSALVRRVELDEPLLGGAEDHRFVAAPAVRVAVRESAFAQEHAALTEQCNDLGIGLETVLPLYSGRPSR